MLTPAEKKALAVQLIEMLEEKALTAERSAGEARQGIVIGAERTRTRGERGTILEGTYLISAQMQQTEAYRRLIAELRQLDLAPARRVVAGSAVRLQEEPSGEQVQCLVLPGGMGLDLAMDNGVTVRLVSPESPLGQALAGRRAGGRVEVPQAGSCKHYRILEIS